MSAKNVCLIPATLTGIRGGGAIQSEGEVLAGRRFLAGLGNRRSNGVSTLGWLVLLVLVGTVAYMAGMRSGGSGSLVLGRSKPGVDYFLSFKSFSEIENTKALLDAECRALISEVRTRYVAQHPEETTKAIAELEDGIDQLKGLKEELLLREELLWFLKKSGRADRWLEVYMGVLYQDPTDSLVGRFATDALDFARGTPREGELLAGFESLISMPLPSEAKNQVQAALQRRSNLSLNGGSKLL